MEATPIVYDKSNKWRGPALSQLRILKQQMQIGGLTVGTRRVTIAEGVAVLCRICFNCEEAFIEVTSLAAEVKTGIFICLTEYIPVINETTGLPVIDEGTLEIKTLLPEYYFVRMQDLQTHEFTSPMGRYGSYWFFRPADDDTALKISSGKRAIDITAKAVLPFKDKTGTNNWQNGKGAFITWDWYGDRYFWGAKNNAVYTSTGSKLLAPEIVRGAGVRHVTIDGKSYSSIIASCVDGKFYEYTSASGVWVEIKCGDGSEFVSMPDMNLPVFFTYDSSTAYAYKDRYYVIGTADYLYNHTGYVHIFSFESQQYYDLSGTVSIRTVVTETLEDNQITTDYVGPSGVPPDDAHIVQGVGVWGVRTLVCIDATDTIVKLHHVNGARANVVIYPFFAPSASDGDHYIMLDGRTEVATVFIPYYNHTYEYMIGFAHIPLTRGSFFVCNGVTYNTAAKQTETGPYEYSNNNYTTSAVGWDPAIFSPYLLGSITPAILTVPVSFDLRKKDIMICTLQFTYPVGAYTNCKLFVCGEEVVDLGAGDFTVPSETQFANFSSQPEVANDPNTQTAYVHNTDPEKAFVFVSWRYAENKVITYTSKKVVDASGDSSMYFKSMTKDKPYFESSKQYFYTGLIKKRRT